MDNILEIEPAQEKKKKLLHKNVQECEFLYINFLETIFLGHSLLKNNFLKC